MGKRALVVGGSGGIGRAVAKALAGRGAGLLVTGGSDKGRLDRTLAELRGLGSEAEGLLLPLEDLRGLDALRLGEGRFDILVAAFGPFLQRPLDAMSGGDWERLALLDLALPGALASALLPGMVARGWGRLVFFGGTGTDVIKAYRTNAAYAAAKTGLGVLAKSIAAGYADRGIASFLVCPGLVDTEYLDPALREALAAKNPKGRLLAADDVGETVAGLLAAEPCLASGALIGLDGGLDLGSGRPGKGGGVGAP